MGAPADPAASRRKRGRLGMSVWPPQRLFASVQNAIDELVEKVAAAGFEPEQVRNAWEEAARIWLRQVHIPSRHKVVKGERKALGRARPSRLLGQALAIMRRFVLTAIPAFTAAQPTIAYEGLLLGLDDAGQPKPLAAAGPRDRRPDPPGVRQTRAVLTALVEAGMFRAIHRWSAEDHAPGEARSTIYVLNIPDAALEAVRKAREERSRHRAFTLPGPAAASSSAASSSPSPRGRAGGATSMTPRAPASSPAATGPSWWLPIAQEIRRAKYPDPEGRDTCNNIRDRGRILEVEGALEGEAAACRAWCEQQGTTALPAVEVVREELARATLEAWLLEDGAKGNAKAQRHPLAWFAGDVGRMLTSCGETWRRAYWRAHRPPPAPPPPPIPEVAQPAREVPTPDFLRRAIERAEQASGAGPRDQVDDVDDVDELDDGIPPAGQRLTDEQRAELARIDAGLDKPP